MRTLRPQGLVRRCLEETVAIRGYGCRRCVLGTGMWRVVGMVERCGCRGIRNRGHPTRVVLPLGLPIPVHLSGHVAALAMTRKQARVRERPVLRSERSGTDRPSIAGVLDVVRPPRESSCYYRSICDPPDAVAALCRVIAGRCGRRGGEVRRRHWRTLLPAQVHSCACITAAWTGGSPRER